MNHQLSNCSKGFTSLHYTALAKYNEMMQFFLNYKANFNILFNYNKISFYLTFFKSLYKIKYFNN